MTDRTEIKLDVALEALAREIAGAAPRPSRVLVGRVLADAGAISAAPDTVACSDGAIDEGLEALARELAEAAPSPGGDLVARVLAGADATRAEARAVDLALDMLGREVTATAPVAGEELVARVLADADAVGAGQEELMPAAAGSPRELARSRDQLKRSL